MIKAIIFDCFGVLTGDRWKEFVATLPDDQRPTASELNRVLDSGEISNAVFLEKISQLTGKTKETISSYIYAEMHKNKELLDYIAPLRPRYKIGLLSNVSSNWIRNFLNAAEQALFDDFVLSFEVGMTKHDARIFKIAADRLGVKAVECVFIDDTENYTITARDEGMKAILYKDFPQMKTELEGILASTS